MLLTNPRINFNTDSVSISVKKSIISFQEDLADCVTSIYIIWDNSYDAVFFAVYLEAQDIVVGSQNQFLH